MAGEASPHPEGFQKLIKYRAEHADISIISFIKGEIQYKSQ
jgi:hypothetical protein